MTRHAVGILGPALAALMVAMAPAIAAAEQPDDGSSTTISTTTPSTTAPSEAIPVPAPQEPAAEPAPVPVPSPSVSPAEPVPAPPAQTDEPVSPVPESGSGLTWVLVAALAVVALALVAATVLLIRFRRQLSDRRYVPQSAYAPVPADAVAGQPSGGGAAPYDRTVADRDRLAATCILLADAVSGNPSLVAQAQQGLSQAGYFADDPTGQRFDSQRHEALQALPTTNPAQDGVIAATPRHGYRRNDRVVRQPGVVVYRYEQDQGRSR